MRRGEALSRPRERVGFGWAVKICVVLDLLLLFPFSFFVFFVVSLWVLTSACFVAVLYSVSIARRCDVHVLSYFLSFH